MTGTNSYTVAGLLFLARDENNEASSFPLGICMIVLVVITLMSLWALRATYLRAFAILRSHSPLTGLAALIRYLPMSLAIRQQQDREIRRRSRLSALLERTRASWLLPLVAATHGAQTLATSSTADPHPR
jgi:hypothetical protein